MDNTPTQERKIRHWLIGLLTALGVIVFLGSFAGILVALKMRDRGEPVGPRPPVQLVVFGDGFSNREENAKDAWHWMADTGVIKLWNHRQDMVLKMNSRAPVDSMKMPPTIELTLDGAPLDTFKGQNNRTTKLYVIPADKLGDGDWLVLRITTSEVAVPSEHNPKSKDHRRLGYQIYQLEWSPKDVK